ncbi:MAG: undecaprenyl-phosphate glucose phosphotransferase [Deltaproteobacteria bacterium]|nr:undecaprenyl-phosphate glucose phosphotransferase [Deltaproteobacteria bacterium]
MLKRHAPLFEALFIASDLLIVSVAWSLSYWLRFASDWFPVDKGIPPFIDYFRMNIFLWLIWAWVYKRFGLYRPMRGSRRLREIWLVIQANFVAVIAFLAFTYLFREKSVPFSRLVFLIFGIVSTILIIASRSAVRGFLRAMRRRGYNKRFALIVGAGDLARQIAHRITSHPEYGVELFGCLSSGKEKRAEKLTGSASHVKFKIVGTYQDLPKIIENHAIDQIIVALPLSDHNKMKSVIASIGDAIMDVRIVPDFHQFIQLGSRVEDFDGLPVVSLASTPLSGINRVAKRITDVCLGMLFLIAALPLMLIIGALVKLTSSGPIFFTQQRVGLDGRAFTMYKFRTMIMDAEADGARFAVRGDSRVTPLGRFLRRFNLDELPQLINVVLGQMSLVGPRPERPVFIKEFRRHVPKYMLRHKVQAGMTGWAQVNGWRGNTSIEKRIDYDLYYIENWSLALDLKILGLTVVNGFRDRNAY